MNQASNIRGSVPGPAVGMIIEMIRHYTVNQASNIRGLVPGPAVGMIIEMIGRHSESSKQHTWLGTSVRCWWGN